MIKALGRSVAREDPEQLAAMLRLSGVLADAVQAAVVGQREDHTWESIADALGVTRQAVIMRFGDAARDSKGPRARR